MYKLIFSLVFLLLTGCTDAYTSSSPPLSQSQLRLQNSEYKVELYSGGQLVKEWTSTSEVILGYNSSHYYFTDKKTNKLVKVVGDLVITQE